MTDPARQRDHDPSPWVVRFASLIPEGGTVLDLAAGRGRHSRWLEAQGHSVTAIDRDVEALAESWAHETIVFDLESGIEWPLTGRRFAAIVVTNYLHRPLLPALTGVLAENGVLLYETFAAGNERFGKPSNPDFLLRPGELLKHFRGLDVVAFEDGLIGDPPTASIQRICAVRSPRYATDKPRRNLVTDGGASRAPNPLKSRTLHEAGRVRGAWSAARLPVTGPFLPRGFFRSAMIQGSIVAMVTPMHPDGSLDLDGYRRLIDWHVAEGTDAIVAVGTTGESPTVSVDEHCTLIRVAVEHAKGRIPIIAGAGGNSTSEAIDLTHYAKSVGADAVLSVVPYYNKPTQEGLYRHFKAIAEGVDIPVIVYNVPGRTVADLSNDTVVRLADVSGIAGIKDATGDIGRGTALIAALPRDFAVYSGDDASAVALMLMGGKGNVSVSANIAPRAMHELCKAAIAGDAKSARDWHLKTLPLHRTQGIEPNPIPVKWALAQMGLIESGIRLPLVSLSAAHQSTVQEALRLSGALQQPGVISRLAA